MSPPRFRVRTLMFVAWLSALLLAGAVDVLEEQRNRNRVEVVGEHVNADGSTSITLLHGLWTTYYLGPIPIGPCPTAAFCGAAFAASIVAWALLRRSEKSPRRGDVVSTSQSDRA